MQETLGVVLLLALPACKTGGGRTDESPADAPIVARVVPSIGDEHLALLPPPVQLLVQANPTPLFADPMLSLAAGAFLAAMSDDPQATSTCVERLSRTAVVVTYAWIGGAADGWVAIVDAPLDTPTVGTCLAALGASPPPGTELDPPPGQAYQLGENDELVLARLGPDRRAIGLALTVEAVRRAALQPPRLPDDPSGAELLPRLRQGDLKLYADFEQLAALGASSLPLIDDADQLALLLRLELMEADVVTLVRARGSGAVARLETTLDGVLSSLRRLVLEEPGVSAGSVYRVFDEARVERLDTLLRLQVTLDRPTLAALIGILAHRALPSIGTPRAPPGNP
ncbi:MAG: hypothetical protein JXB32_22860 [Deltaproteobacteria bacterium]|nr:hypothetical protein [Deltaproteobacteria bacterium]